MAPEAKGLFELDLPSGGPARGSSRLDLDRAIELCRLYRQWFDLSGPLALRNTEPRCFQEFVL